MLILVDQLSIRDQARLVARLTPRIAAALEHETESHLATPTATDAWHELVRIGAELGALGPAVMRQQIASKIPST